MTQSCDSLPHRKLFSPTGEAKSPNSLEYLNLDSLGFVACSSRSFDRVSPSFQTANHESTITRRRDVTKRRNSFNLDQVVPDRLFIVSSTGLHNPRLEAPVGPLASSVLGILLSWSPLDVGVRPGPAFDQIGLNRASFPSDRLHAETTLLWSALFGSSATHLAFAQGVRVDLEPQGREIATSWIRLELHISH